MTIKNVNVNQVARAQIAKCISNIQVRVGNGTRPLKKFIEDHEDQIEVTPLRGGAVAPDGQPIRNSNACPSVEDANTFFKYSVAGSIALVVLVALILGALLYTDDDEPEE